MGRRLCAGSLAARASSGPSQSFRLGIPSSFVERVLTAGPPTARMTPESRQRYPSSWVLEERRRSAMRDEEERQQRRTSVAERRSSSFHRRDSRKASKASSWSGGKIAP